MRHIALRIAAILVAVAGFARTAGAEPLVADLSQDVIAIHSGFVGVDLLLFGATDGPGDVIVVVRGPQAPVVVREKNRVAGIWVHTEEAVFDHVPGYYAVAATRPLEELGVPEMLATRQIGVDALRLPVRTASLPEEIDRFRTALIRNKQRLRLFSEELRSVRFIGNRLFRTTFHIPATVPTGSYIAETYLLRDGALVRTEAVALLVHKTGIESAIYDFARYRAWLYGFLAVALAIMAGWLADMIFRRA